jgi:hypothetical protein
MILVSGSSPLAPTEVMIWAYETSLSQGINNVAQATANPIDTFGNDIPVLVDEEDEGTAGVIISRMIPTLNIWSILFMLLLMITTGLLARRKFS